MDQSNKDLLQFPCKFPIKVVGYAVDNLEENLFKIVKTHVPELENTHISTRASKDGKYLSITFNIQANSKAQLDKIYLDLNAYKDVVMCL